jgi:hypothetical protein
MKIFWAWQSDTDGATGRHFIRDALAAAIKQLKQPEDIEDPAERDLKSELHLDHDRKGVSGSPDLAKLIFDKIDQAAVFVADVTPVATIKRRRLPEGGMTEEKRNMNPNVAIELGYALRRQTQYNVLMVLNSHYGGRKFLPFDLIHKSGPIIYELAPDAAKEERQRVFADLRGSLVAALRPFIKVPPAPAASRPAFIPARPTASAAVFFEPNETLATFGIPSDNYRCFYPDRNGIYLRLQPTEARKQPFTTAMLVNEARRAGLRPFWKNPSSLVSDNKYGVAVVEPERAGDGGPLIAVTQVFRSGELWGIARWLLIENQYGKLISAPLFESTAHATLRQYAEFLASNLKIAPPYRLVAGGVGLKGYDVAVDVVDQRWQVLDDDFVVEHDIADGSTAAIAGAVLALSTALFALTGYPRPADQLKPIGP